MVSKYWKELKTLWLIEQTKRVLRLWSKAEIDGWSELLLWFLAIPMFLAIWLLFPISYPVLTALRVRKDK